ncbi:cysteine hydrolase family protein [Stenoxybacter acetivorans]|uniref:cysteine hydrolase family protein n=1 Tax=Stenoxybacter acetivorans TaxID=422441 RepID=UPI000566CA35|nr:isochorismatase family cysteine hydrolase [Stenoxybacter acetivorans]
MQAIIVIDYSYDFVATDGALTTGVAGQRIEKSLVEEVKKFHDQGDFVVFAMDLHEKKDKYHPEIKLFPHHNLKDSQGRQLFGSLKILYDEIKGNDNVYFMDKRRYSAFSGTDLDIRLRERGITEITLVGVCTDICVLHTAVDAYNLGYKINIPQEAVASFDPKGHQFALNHFSNTLGANVY